MTERDKIIDIVERSRTCGINNSCYECKYNKELENYKDVSCGTLRTADALLENGIGDVAEWKHRAEVAERNDKIKDMALDKATELAYECRTETDTLSCSSCPMFHIFDSCKERGLYKDCSKRWKEEILSQAERKIVEEKRNELY